jgi:Tfp pilus assembly protein PilO
MKSASSSSGRLILAVLVIVVLAIVFWMTLLSPKRKESDELGAQVEQQQATLAETQSTIATAEAARRDFPRNYQQLVVLGKAAPASDETSSLLIELNHISDQAGVKFESLTVGTADGEGESAAIAPETTTPEEEPPATEGETAPATEASAGVPASAVLPTEATASLLPIGAMVGPAGLNTLPYDLKFKGSFFGVADFLDGLDSLVHTGGRTVAVDGRLVTVDGFSLSPSPDQGFKKLSADFSVTTYLVPPGQGITAGATPTAPAEAEATPTSTSSELR